MRRLAIAVALLVAASPPARASEKSEAEARQLYSDGKTAFERGDYQAAYDDFKHAYLISQRPELLFNMSSAAKELGRPHDAAEHLRAYLRVVPNTPDRPQIEERILTLEEAQKILDSERANSPPAAARPSEGSPPPPAAPPPAASATPPPAAASATPAPSTRADLVTSALPPPHRHRTALIVGLSVGAVVVAGAVALGLAFGLHRGTASLTHGTLGTVEATP